MYGLIKSLESGRLEMEYSDKAPCCWPVASSAIALKISVGNFAVSDHRFHTKAITDFI
jgi:hypothetical protein